MELSPIDAAQYDAEKFFEREDVQSIFREAVTLSTCSLPNYQVGKTLWERMYKAPHPSKQKRDELHELERDLYHVACALNRRVKTSTLKPQSKEK